MTDMIHQFESIFARCRQRAGDPSPLRLIAEAAERSGRPLASPLRVRMEMIDSCRQQCLFCVQAMRAPRKEHGPVPRDRVHSRADELARLGVAEVVITGGEPGCHPELSGIVRDCKEAGLTVVLETSGVDLSSSVLSELAAHLEPDRDLVRVSMDGATAETYRILRGVDAFGELLQVLDSLGRMSIPFATTTVMMAANRRELAQIANHAREAGARACDFGPPFLPGGSSLPGELGQDELLRCCEELLDLPATTPLRLHILHALRKAAPSGGPGGFACTAGLTECAVDVQGRVAACSFLNDAGLNDAGRSVGTWEPGTFARLWNRIGLSRTNREQTCSLCHC